MELKRALLWPDTHINSEDHRAIQLLYEIGSYAGIDALYLMGDFADMFGVTGHPRDIGSDVVNYVQKEIIQVNKRLDEIDSIFNCPKTYISGNHEYRLYRFIRDKCSELYGLLELPGLFKLDQRPQWEWVEYSHAQRVRVLGSKLYARHEPQSRNAVTAVRKAMCNIAFGHTHKMEFAEVVAMDGKKYRAIACGHMCNTKKTAFRYLKTVPDWGKGFVIIDVDPKTKNFYPTMVPIQENYTAVYAGKLFRG